MPPSMGKEGVLSNLSVNVGTQSIALPSERSAATAATLLVSLFAAVFVVGGSSMAVEASVVVLCVDVTAAN